MSAITSWNEQEEELLSGLPLAAQVLYLRGLRRYMDYGTGCVGDGRRISWQALREALYVESHQGERGAGLPTLAKTRRLMQRLIQAGLVEDIGSKQRGEAIIFFLPEADRDDQASKKPGMKPARNRQGLPGTDRDEKKPTTTGVYEARKQETRHEPGKDETQKAGTHPVSGIRKSLRAVNTAVVLAADQTPVQAVFGHWQAVMGKPRAKLDPKRSKAIAARIAEGYSVDEIKQAVDGCKCSAWHQGANDRKQRYDDLELICRDAGRLDRFIALAKDAKTQRTETEEWVLADRVIEGVFKHVR